MFSKRLSEWYLPEFPTALELLSVRRRLAVGPLWFGAWIWTPINIEFKPSVVCSFATSPVTSHEAICITLHLGSHWIDNAMFYCSYLA